MQNFLILRDSIRNYSTFAQKNIWMRHYEISNNVVK